MVKHSSQEYFKEIGIAIAQARKEMGLTQERLAELVEISQSVLAHYETGIRRIPLPILVKISSVLQVSLDDLVPDRKNLITRRGPLSRIDKEFAKVKLLPEKQQQMIVDMLQSIIKHSSPDS